MALTLESKGTVGSLTQQGRDTRKPRPSQPTQSSLRIGVNSLLSRFLHMHTLEISAKITSCKYLLVESKLNWSHSSTMHFGSNAMVKIPFLWQNAVLLSEELFCTCVAVSTSSLQSRRSPSMLDGEAYRHELGSPPRAARARCMLQATINKPL